MGCRASNSAPYPFSDLYGDLQDPGASLKRGLSRAITGKLRTTKDRKTQGPAREHARLLLILDQLEELFTTDSITRDDVSAFLRAVQALASTGLVWIVGTLRSDFLHHIGNEPGLAALSDGGPYFLLPPNSSERPLERPARSGPIPPPPSRGS